MSSYDITIVEKPAAGSGPTSSATHQKGQTAQRHHYDDLITLLAEMPDEEFRPYPICSLRQLRQVHTFFVAYTDSTSASPSSVPSSPVLGTDACPPADPAAAASPRTECCGLIGVVWVPLSGAASHAPATDPVVPASSTMLPAVEGYLQVVVVPRAYRQRGIAKALLQACLAAYVPESSCGASERASTTVQRVRHHHPRRVLRWRLHTMRPTPATLRCLHTHFFSPTSEATAETEAGRDENDDGTPRQAAASWETMRAELQAGMHAVTGLYESHGFVVRRQLSRYYADEADGVEMVRTVAALSRQGHSLMSSTPPVSVARKRSRSCAEN